MTVRASRWQERSKGGMAMATSAQQADRLCLSLRLLYNRRMAFDPANPPIWLRKLHVTASQIDPGDYAPTPEEGILRVCQLSDAHQIIAKAFADALFPVSPDVDTHADH